MKRDPRLHGLSNDHHTGLLLAQRIRTARAKGGIDREFIRQVAGEFQAQVEVHFTVEERFLLPALRAVGEGAHADRLQREHDRLCALIHEAERDPEKLDAFATLLHDHIRHEEREVFPLAEARCAPQDLDRIGVERPHFPAKGTKGGSAQMAWQDPFA